METNTLPVETTETHAQVEVTAAPAPSKQELLDADRRAKRAAKATEKNARKVANAAKRADGVIGTIRSMLEQPTGATRKEVLDVLTVKFPTRDPLGMAVTVGIQFSRLAKVGGAIGNYKHITRGRVYGFEKVLVRPAVVVEATPAAVTEPVVQAEQIETAEVAAPVELTGKAARRAAARAGR